MAARTEWNSPRVLGVVRRKGGWLGVQAPELRNGEVGWIRARQARLDCTTWSLHADLSQRKLFVRRDGRTVRALAVAAGRSGHATPRGRFSVTDKLRVTDPAPPTAGALALSGHQAGLPAAGRAGTGSPFTPLRTSPASGKPRVSAVCARVRARPVG